MNNSINSQNVVVSPSIFISSEEYKTAISIWKNLSNEKKATVEHHAMYCILFGKDIKKAFSPISNQNKIVSNANDPYFALRNALEKIKNFSVSAFEPWQSFYSKDIDREKYSKSCYIRNNQDEFLNKIAIKAKELLSTI